MSITYRLFFHATKHRKKVKLWQYQLKVYDARIKIGHTEWRFDL